MGLDFDDMYNDGGFLKMENNFWTRVTNYYLVKVYLNKILLILSIF